MSVTNRRSLPLQFACLVIGVSSVLPAFAVLDTDATQKLAKASVPFIHNRGQWDKTAAFGAHTFAGTLFVTTEGNLVYNLPGKLVAGPAPEPAHGKRATAEMRNGERTPGWVLTETFVGSDQQVIRASPNGYLPATAKVSYFIGNDERRHRRDVGTFERVDLGDVFPGINVQLRATGANVEKIFTVAPGHDPAGIRVRIDGTTRLELGPDGELIAVTGNGPLAYSAPIAFQEDDRGVRHPVAVRYALDAQTRNYGFIVDTYDTTRALVIDPLLRSTYLGANGDDVASAIAIHPVSGEVYVAGSTSSMTNTFPGVGGGYQPSNGGGPADAFVSRYSPDLSTLYQSTYLGGGTNDSARALAIHPVSGDIYVAGYTFSLTNTFPGVNGGAQANSGGNQDGFVSRLSADLTVLRRSTYLGAGLDELANALAIHPVSGDIYVAGSTTATTNTFPGLAGATQGNSGGGTDGFVSRFSADLGTLFRSSYLGAGGTDVAQTLAVHPVTGEIYVAGYTNSPGTSFPGAGGGAQRVFGGTNDAFVSRFSADLGTLVNSTYLGATDSDKAYALAIHPGSGDIYLVGETGASGSTFPGVGGGAQKIFGGSTDAFVSRFSADLATLHRSSYLGAIDVDIAFAVAVHPISGEVYVAGYSITTGSTFPGVSGGARSTSGGSYEAFVSRFNADLTALLKSSYLGAAGDDLALAMAIHPVSGDVYLTGETSSPTGTFPGLSGAPQGVYGGGTFDGFVSRFSADLTLADTTPNAFAFAAQNNVPVSSVRTSEPVQINGLGAAANAYVDGQPGSTFCVSSSNDCSCNVSGSFVASGLVSDSQYVCVRQTASALVDQITSTTLHVGAQAGVFRVSTGNVFGGGCTFDVDGNGTPDALTDGLVILRAMFGLTGTPVTNGAIGAGATRATWAALRAFTNGNCGTNFAP